MKMKFLGSWFGGLLYPESPHLKFPFSFTKSGGRTRAAVVEQDSPEEVLGCALVILSYELGSRIELPSFGLPDQTFVLGGADTTVIEATLARWDERALADIAEDSSQMDQLIDIVRIQLGDEENA